MTATVTAATIRASLRESITSGRRPPGTVLRQADLADEFGTSRIPVREALVALQGEGLLVIEPHRGAYVATLSTDELDEIFDLRVLLECDVLRHAVPLHDDRSVRHLEALQRELDAESEPERWVMLDRSFHDVLYAPSGRTRSLALVAGLRSSVERFYLARLGPDTRRGGWNDEHAQLIAAVVARKPKRAADLLREHLRETRRVALAALEPS